MSVPWFIGSNGALHPPEVLRMLAYAATGGAEGIVSATDMKVTQKAAPGAGVTISPGGIAMLNRSPGGSFQTYLDREGASVDVAIAATGAGVPRSDLIVRRVEDPDYPSWAVPADPVNGPYARYAVISGVPNTTKTAKALNLNYPAVELARIDVPASTSVILNAHIIPLAKVAQPRRQREVDAVFPAVEAYATTGAIVTLGTSRAILVPEWATYATIRAEFTGVLNTIGAVDGWFYAKFANVTAQPTRFDVNYTATWRTTYSVLGEIAIDAQYRDTLQTLAFQQSKPAGAGFLKVDTGASLFADIEFLERA